MNQAVILAGGKGTRLAAALGRDIPKPMAPLCGKPLLEHLVCLLRGQGVRKILMLVHYRAEVIREHFGNGGEFGVQIEYCEETVPRGTGGALLDALPFLEDNFLVLYGDTLVDLDISKITGFHERNHADLTLFAHPNDHPYDSDLIECDDGGRVLGLHPYPHPANSEFGNLVNAAFYVFRRSLLDASLLPEGAFDIAKHAIPLWLSAGRRIFAFRGDGYIKDMGTPERLAKVENHLLSGVVARKSGHTPRPAVFLDRDGTLNIEKGHLHSPDQLELLPGTGGAIRELNQLGIPAILVTNQPVIARGATSFEDMKKIHARLEKLLAADGAYLDLLLLCPHHPDKGFPGERPELKVSCSCRKPATGLVDRACGIYSIDRTRSYLIGDRTQDIECAHRADLRSVLVRTGAAGMDGKFSIVPDLEAPDLPSAVDLILSELKLKNPPIPRP